MCGIVGYTGTQSVVPILLNGLHQLSYRGYDSSGIAIFQKTRLVVVKRTGKVVKLLAALTQHPIHGTCGIGHTRWATHGQPAQRNAHPHRSGPVVLVHNGIIENHLLLKKSLQRKGYHFRSETDTEVLAHLLADYLTTIPSLLEAVKTALRAIEGQSAFVAMALHAPSVLVAATRGCPLVVGCAESETWVASDQSVLHGHTPTMRVLQDGDVAALTPTSLTIFNEANQLVMRPATPLHVAPPASLRTSYKHTTLREIHEQPATIKATIHGLSQQLGFEVTPEAR